MCLLNNDPAGSALKFALNAVDGVFVVREGERGWRGKEGFWDMISAVDSKRSLRAEISATLLLASPR